jgi:phospholipid/cholesterol/gamma-HCH transport system substrate-binding protein
MPNLKTNLQVGVFVALTLLFILGIIFTLGSQTSVLGGSYSVIGKFKQTQGLFSGGTVSFSGIKVGNIGNINYDSKSSLVKVEMKIKEEYKKLITQGAVASIKTQGALGDKFLYIEPGDYSKPPLEHNDEILTIEPEDLFDLVTEKTKDLSQVVDLIKEVRLLVKSFNDGNKVGLIMGNLEASTKDLKLVMRDVRGDNQELRKGVEHFSSIMKKIDQGEGTLGALINDKGLHDRISKMVGANPAKSYMKPLIRATIKEE